MTTSTEDFVKNFTSKADSLANPLSSSTDMQNLAAPYEMPQQQQPMVAMPMQQPISQYSQQQDIDLDSSNQLLWEAHQTTNNMIESQNFLKEQYLKESQYAANLEKEIIKRDLSASQFQLKEAIDDGNSELQAHLHTKISADQSKLLLAEDKFNNWQNEFVDNFAKNQPQPVNYAPQYNEEQPVYNDPYMGQQQTYPAQNYYQEPYPMNQQPPNPYMVPQMPAQQPQMQYQMPMQQQQQPMAYQQPQYYAPQPQQGYYPTVPQYGPPVAPVGYNMNQSQMNPNVDPLSYSEPAFKMFENALPGGMKLNHQQKLDLFYAANRM